ncbi:MAG: cytidylate kinase-like family protein [Tissierellia bacterium]|nr:cytidylate kinase-like family protein [Tissierellia bacterium]
MEVLTISREFGSGGRTIAKEVADRLGYTYYDDELITKIAEESGFDIEYIREHGEETSYANTFLYNFFLNFRQGGAQEKVSSAANQLFIEQFKIINKIAREERCVIVGRCSDYILRDMKECLHAHIHAADEIRAKRIVEIYGETTKSPETRILEKDKKRMNYYRYYTGRNWGMAKNYTVSLDSGVLGIEQCVDIIVEMMKKN